jgi:hypothetical protein
MIDKNTTNQGKARVSKEDNGLPPVSSGTPMPKVKPAAKPILTKVLNQKNS